MKYLFLFTIGPVQGFISKSRKTQDLYNGSIILSDLIEYAIAKLPKDSKPIFPNNDNLNDKHSNPNRFLAVIETENPEIIGRQIGEAVKNKFEFIAQSLLKDKCNKDISEYLKSKFDKQLNDFPDIFWTMIPFDENSYNKGYEKIEQNMGAIKNIRKFDQNEETGRKCSICGERDVIFYNPKKNCQDKDIAPKYLNKFIKVNDNMISEGEGLCSLCFVKRYYGKASSKSTAEIAVINAVNKLNKSGNGDLLVEYINYFKPNDFNYEFLFEENLTPNKLQEYGINFNSKEYTEILKKRKAITEILKNEKTKITGYYGIVLSDGDSMGKWLTGKRTKENISLLNFHKDLSFDLKKFATESRKYLDESGFGKTIYAGGEDFMGFVNVSNLFEVEMNLKKNFYDYVSKPLKKYFKDENDNITFSAGIVIAHYKTPLSEVLKAVRNMEEYAKDIDGKKDTKKIDKYAFAISVLKHSGEIAVSRYKWETNGFSTLDRVDEIISSIKKGDFSPSFINTLQSEFYLISENKDKGDYFNAMIKAEIERLIFRACCIEKCKGESNEDYKKRKQESINKMSEKVFSLYNDDFNNFISMLRICEFLMREGYYVN